MSDSAEAAGVLGRAAALERAARAGSGWYGRYLGVFAVGQLVLVPMALLWHGPAAAAVFAVVNTAMVTGLSVYAARQRVIRRGFGLRHGLVIGVWAVAFAAAVVLGSTVFTDHVGFAAVAALVCALPAALGARSELRGAP
ncbi:hypothetical protein OOK31_22710 [Streptomyces sp. NBC_00249]|uniref:hypothetical protein n=1 Tax=Streptomyces sp. NBC_00249 TaxID=2975690 RepID=UPI0022577D0E|nr:hypothetical protein [Streptomyces sp. NBC_00249]MCX5196668.1 hypothetical protein [Streptomyces sp. NBC_00249]